MVPHQEKDNTNHNETEGSNEMKKMIKFDVNRQIIRLRGKDTKNVLSNFLHILYAQMKEAY